MFQLRHTGLRREGLSIKRAKEKARAGTAEKAQGKGKDRTSKDGGKKGASKAGSQKRGDA